MSIDATNWAWSQSNITSTEKLILLSYADRAGESMEAWPSKKRLERDTCLCFNSIDKGIKSLTRKGLMVKTGEEKNQVPVYRLIGVTLRESNQNNKSKKQSPPNITPPKYGMGTPPKYAPPTPPKYGIQNHQLNPKRNPNTETPIFSSFEDFKTFVVSEVDGTGKEPLDTLVEEVLFYAKKLEGKRLPIESVKIAIPLIKKGLWKTPHGYNGFSSKSIAQKDELYERQKQEQIIADGKINRLIKAEIKKEKLGKKVNVMEIVYGIKSKCQPGMIANDDSVSSASNSELAQA